MKNRNSIMTVTLVVIVAKLVAFLKEFVLSYFFGVSAVTDAYGIAYTIPITIVSFVAVGINTSYIPIFNKAQKETGDSGALAFSNSVLSLVFWISAVTFLLITAFAPQIVNAFAVGFDADTAALTVMLTRYMAPSVFFLCYNRVISAYLQLKDKYYVVTLCEILLYGFSILGIVAGFYWQVEWLSFGVLIGYMLESLMLTVMALRKKHSMRFTLIPNNPYVKELIFLVLPVMIGSFASDINKVVGKSVASMCQEGAISILNYAHKIDEAILSIFVTSLVAVAYPRLAKAVSSGEEHMLQRQIRNDLIYMLALTMPILAGVLIFSREIVSLLFVRGAFTAQDGVMVANAFLIYIIGMIPTSLRKYYVRIFYSFSDSKTPAMNSLLIVGINIALSILFARLWGLYGIAISSSVSIFVGMLHLVIKTRKWVKIRYMPILVPAGKIILASAVMAVTTRLLYNSLFGLVNANLLLIGCVAAACLIYVVLIFVFRLNYLLAYLKK